MKFNSYITVFISLVLLSVLISCNKDKYSGLEPEYNYYMMASITDSVDVLYETVIPAYISTSTNDFPGYLSNEIQMENGESCIMTIFELMKFTESNILSMKGKSYPFGPAECGCEPRAYIDISLGGNNKNFNTSACATSNSDFYFVVDDVIHNLESTSPAEYLVQGHFECHLLDSNTGDFIKLEKGKFSIMILASV